MNDEKEKIGEKIILNRRKGCSLALKVEQHAGLRRRKRVSVAEAAQENDGNTGLKWPVAEPSRALCAPTHICKYMWISYKM